MFYVFLPKYIFCSCSVRQSCLMVCSKSSEHWFGAAFSFLVAYWERCASFFNNVNHPLTFVVLLYISWSYKSVLLEALKIKGLFCFTSFKILKSPVSLVILHVSRLVYLLLYNHTMYIVLVFSWHVFPHSVT